MCQLFQACRLCFNMTGIRYSGSWEALYQQNPIITGGGVFPIERIQVRPIQPDRSQILRSVRFVDKAGTSDGGAFTAMVLMHLMHDKSYVIEHVARGQW